MHPYSIMNDSDAEKSNISSNKKERFDKIATARTNKILNDLRLLGNCSNRTSYEYTQDEVNQMFRAIKEAVSEAEARFNRKGSKSEFSFKK